ncbi:uncharacterized protein EDB91DRAFT_1076770 [Suillus paluster]|uniref:uncharacterized protein n=1 Tax=Suillus paluster TaxID=48578 RepID=UPI001B874FA8|nr:uncharacterized protein EDB91DRAFT_1076770 [Suillus paluster]KAG1756854.1 hypothetical protein EDB91DRAFT_1076770 [Suillus paluster]
MQAIEMTTANSKANILDMIDALQNIALVSAYNNVHSLQLACSQVTIPDLETPYSSFPNTDQSIHQDHISAIINERQKQLDAVLHEISGMETVVDGLKNLHQQLVEKKDRITQSMNMHKRFGSALWRLPTEVLSQIFYHCLPKDRILWFSPSSREAPMLLTEVCRGWREVAVGIPGLWRRLYMQVNNSDWQEVAFCYDSWLKRSRGCRLSLQLNCDADDSIKLRSLVQPYINQITSLCIYFFSDMVQPELLLINLPAFQELKIRNFQDFPSVPQYISRMPSTLRSLDVSGLWFNLEHLSSFDPVWANLTNIGIDIYQLNEFLHLLQLCPNLSSLTVYVRRRFDRTMTLEPFTHSEIRYIRFS